MVKNYLKQLGGFTLSFCMELFHLVQGNIPVAAVFLPDYRLHFGPQGGRVLPSSITVLAIELRLTYMSSRMRWFSLNTVSFLMITSEVKITLIWGQN